MTHGRLLKSIVRQEDDAPLAKLVVVVPAFNEEANLEHVVRELRALRLPRCEVSFVIVDDGSSDRTRQVARELDAPLISLPYNMGIGIAVQTGFKYAVEHGADYVVQVDGDCQHIPQEIAKLLAPVRDGSADMVIGTRFSNSTWSGHREGLAATTLTRWLVGRVLAFNIRALTGLRISDTTSGFRLYNRETARYIAENYPDDYPEVEVLVPLARNGYRVREVSVRMRARHGGQSSINWHRAVYYVFKVILATAFSRVRRIR